MTSTFVGRKVTKSPSNNSYIIHKKVYSDNLLWHLQEYCALDEASSRLLRSAMDRFDLSARAYSRILKVARTIADLAGSATIQPPHIAEAVGYRNLDRGTWGE